MTTIISFAAYRKYLLTQIVLARREYYRLKAELANSNQPIPQGCYIGKYRSNYEWEYFMLGHKNAVLPSARDPKKLTIKRHLGLTVNPHYFQALLDLEATRTYQIKKETLHGIANHLLALKSEWRFYREWFLADKRQQQLKINRKDSPITADFLSAFIK